MEIISIRVLKMSAADKEARRQAGTSCVMRAHNGTDAGGGRTVEAGSCHADTMPFLSTLVLTALKPRRLSTGERMRKM